MAMKTVRLAVTVGIVDPERSAKLLLDKDGRQIQAAITEIKHIPAGEPIELEAKEADRLVAQFGVFDEAAAAIKAKGVTVATARR